MERSPALEQIPAPQAAGLGRLLSWSLFGNLVYAGCQWAMLMLLAKLGQPETVGIFALALAVTAPVFAFANFQLRAIQAGDVRADHAFASYFGFRIVTSALGLGAILVAGFLADSRLEVVAVILLVGLAKAAESLSDILYGLFQKHERLDRMALSMVVKGLLALLGLGLGMALFQSLLVGAGLMAVGWIALFLAYDLPNARALLRRGADVRLARPQFALAAFRALLLLSLPMAVVVLMNSLSQNVPRYFIARHYDADELGYYAAIAYLMTAMGVVSTAIGNSILTRFAIYFGTDRRAFIGLLVKGLLLLGGISLVGLVAALLYGPELLTLLYTDAYAGYAPVLVQTMIGALLVSLGSVLGTAMTAARSFWPQAVNAGLFLATAAAASAVLVPLDGAFGAAVAFNIAAAVKLAALAVNLARVLR